MREISFEMARDMGLIRVASTAEISDATFFGHSEELSPNELEQAFRGQLEVARRIKTVMLEGELLKVV